jgi:hypothetical protein
VLVAAGDQLRHGIAALEASGGRGLGEGPSSGDGKERLGAAHAILALARGFAEAA